MNCPDPVSPTVRTYSYAMNLCEHLRRNSKLSFWPPTSLFTAPKAPSTTGRFKLTVKEIVASLLALGCCCWCPYSWIYPWPPTNMKSPSFRSRKSCSFQGWHCGSSACFSIPSAHTAWEKENTILGLARRQENPTRPLPCWSMISCTVFLSQLEFLGWKHPTETALSPESEQIQKRPCLWPKAYFLPKGKDTLQIESCS